MKPLLRPGQVASALRDAASALDRHRSKQSVQAALAHLQGAVHSPICASLRPSVRSSHFSLIGSDFAVPFFHAGHALVDPLTTDSFFDGWYGWGFYAAFDPEYVRRWYGPVVTRLRAKPGAKVLLASISAYSSSAGLLDKVFATEAAAIGDEAKWQEMRTMLLENQLLWVHAVDRVAIEEYDIVLYSDEQIVVKNPDSVIVEGEQAPPDQAPAA